MTTGMSTAGATNLEKWLTALSVEELKQVAINSLTFTKITVREYPVEYIRARVLRKITTWPIGSLRHLGYSPHEQATTNSGEYKRRDGQIHEHDN